MTKQGEIAIEFTHVQKKFSGKAVIKDLNLAVPANQIFVLVGPSGSGKTTILKMINALIQPNGGKITINGKKITEYRVQDLRWQMGYVLQQIALFPNMTVAQNIAVIPEMKKMPKKKIKERIETLLAQVDLPAAKYAERYPRELSGGEAQRVGIVRALAADPPLILMDEPFSALDPLSRTQLQKLVLRLQAQLHKTVVFVTHDMNEALKMGDAIAVVHHGKIQQVGTPREVQLHPATEYVARFFADTQKRDLLGATLAEIITTQVAQKIEATPAKPVAAQATILDVSGQLSMGKVIYTQDEHGNYWEITAATVLQFLTLEERKDQIDVRKEKV